MLNESLDQHRTTGAETPVLKTVIEDPEIQRILRNIMETYDPDGMEVPADVSGENDFPEELGGLIERLKNRQREILSRFDSEGS